MAQALITERLRQQSTVSVRRETAYAVVTLLAVALITSLAIYSHTPPAVVPASAPPSEFSAERAAESLRVISSSTRPTGSSGHTVAADYIFQKLSAMGLEPQIQQTTAVNQTWGIPFRAAMVRNVVARLKGREDGPALLLASHYDTVPQSYGASDDGSGVALMLETMRALKATGPLKNDVVVLFSDAEEVGMLGAKAFMEQHPWAAHVGLVINFEARGTSGPALMFETSRDNNWLIQEFSRSAVHPVTNSLFYEAYKFLPNDTDLTIFKEGGLTGLNFAFIDSSTNYHTRLDKFENLDARSLQHAGANALSLAQHFGNVDLTQTKRGGDAVYFDVLGLFVVSYPASWVLPLTLLTIVLFFVIVGAGLRRRELTLKGMLSGVFAFVLSLVCVGVVVSLCWRAARAANGAYGLMEGRELYNSLLYLLAFGALTVATVSALYALVHQRLRLKDLWAGALACWLLLLAASSFYVPGVSYLFMWPLLSSLVALGGTLVLKERNAVSVKYLAILLAGVIPGLVLWVPIVYLLFIGLTAEASAIVMVLTALLLGLLIPHLRLISVNKWALPAALAVISIVFFVAGSVTDNFDRERPRPDNIFYAFNGDTGKAVWASADAQPAAWSTQFFQTGVNRDPLAEYFPFRAGDFLTSEAPAATFAAPALEVLSDSSENGVRKLKLRATSPRGASVLTVHVASDAEITEPAINGTLLAARAGEPNGEKTQWGFRYHAVPPAGVELTFTTKSTGPLTVRLIDQSYGLPEISGSSFKTRPEDSMASLAFFSDSTLASKSFVF
jgi:hypothetical protein